MSELERNKINQSPENIKDLEKQAEQGKERIDKQLHENLEKKSPEKTIDDQAEAKRSAIESAESAKDQEKAAKLEAQKQLERERNPAPRSKAERKKAYDKVMNEARSHMSGPSKAFSKVIHNEVVEAVSEATGKTIARPNAILGGSLTAFIVVTVVYIVARHYGYPLSGTETIIAFAGGWVLGILFDYMRVMITGKK